MKNKQNKFSSRNSRLVGRHYSNEKRAKYPNGDIWCEKWNDRIDRYACIGRSVVYPDRCSGCPANL